MKAFFLDFDGVVIDSIEECYQVARDAYFGFADLPVDEETIRTLFVKYRGIVRPAYQYLFLLKAIASVGYQDRKDDILRSFEDLEQSVSQQKRDLFEAVFFQIRAVKQRDLQSWIMLNPPTEYGQMLRGKVLDNYFIVTTKDRYSVQQLLKNNAIQIENIYDRDDYKKYGNKGEIINHILTENQQYDTAIFVDDAVEHLDAVTNPRVKCYFADWGYGENSGYDVFPFKEDMLNT